MKLDLSSNRLSGTLPESLGKLRQVRFYSTAVATTSASMTSRANTGVVAAAAALAR